MSASGPPALAVFDRRTSDCFGLAAVISHGSGRLRRALAQQTLLPPVGCERRRLFERSLSFRVAAELLQQVATNTWSQVVGLQRRLVRQPIDDGQRRSRIARHADGDRTIERDDWRRHDACKLRIIAGDPRPISRSRGPRLRMAGGNRRLDGVKSSGSAERARLPESLHSPTNLVLIPERAV